MRRLRLSVSRVVLPRGVIVASRVNGFFTPKMVTLQNEGSTRERKRTAVATTTANEEEEEEEEEEEDPLRDFPLQNPSSSCRNPAARRRLNLAYAR